MSPVATLLGGALVGGGGGGARFCDAGGGTAGLDPGIGGGRLDLFAAAEGVVGEVGEASFDAIGDSDGTWTGGPLGLDGRLGGGPLGGAPRGIEGGPSRLPGRDSSLVSNLRDAFRARSDSSSSDSEPSLGESV